MPAQCGAGWAGAAKCLPWRLHINRGRLVPAVRNGRLSTVLSLKKLADLRAELRIIY